MHLVPKELTRNISVGTVCTLVIKKTIGSLSKAKKRAILRPDEISKRADGHVRLDMHHGRAGMSDESNHLYTWIDLPIATCPRFSLDCRQHVTHRVEGR